MDISYLSWLIILLVIVVIGVIVWFSRRPSRSERTKIRGQTCHKCGSSDVRWAGYSDRKECAKCGKIFG